MSEFGDQLANYLRRKDGQFVDFFQLADPDRDAAEAEAAAEAAEHRRRLDLIKAIKGQREPVPEGEGRTGSGDSPEPSETVASVPTQVEKVEPEAESDVPPSEDAAFISEFSGMLLGGGGS